MLEYSDLEQSDLDEIAGLYELYLNSGTGVKGWLKEGLSSPGYCGVKCTNGGRIVGVISARPGIDFTCRHEDIIRHISRQWSGYKLYTGDMMVVLPEYRGHGIARELTERLRKMLVGCGSQGIVVEAWRRARKHDMPAGGILKYFGQQTIVGIFEDFYKDLGKYGMTCPDCGSSCRCGAKVIVIEMESGGGL